VGCSRRDISRLSPPYAWETRCGCASGCDIGVEHPASLLDLRDSVGVSSVHTRIWCVSLVHGQACCSLRNPSLSCLWCALHRVLYVRPRRNATVRRGIRNLLSGGTVERGESTSDLLYGEPWPH
ncbi:unnamed protein product, partial [Hapterophycus canaliculatus]